MTRGKVHTYFVYHEEGSHYQRADSLEEEGDAYVFRLGGEVVLHLEKRSVKTLRLLSDKEADEIRKRVGVTNAGVEYQGLKLRKSEDK